MIFFLACAIYLITKFYTSYTFTFPSGSDSKPSAYTVGDLGSIPGLGRSSWRRKCKPIPVFLPGESHGWRNLVGYSPQGCKESDTTDWLHFTSFHFIHFSSSFFQTHHFIARPQIVSLQIPFKNDLNDY